MENNNKVSLTQENEKQDQLLLEPYHYLCNNPGKAFRTQLLEAFQHWLKIDLQHLSIISEVLEMLHNASLLIDDVQDDSELRRGNPVAHRIYGVPITINCANYVYFLALEKICQLNNTNLVKIYSEELIMLHKGQGFELYCRDRHHCPTEEQYIEMVQNKTGGLLRLGVKMMGCLSNDDRDYIPLVNLLGQIYQIRDDYINLKKTDYHNAKGFCEDLTEGKYSFPIIHSIKTSSNLNQLENILHQHTHDIELKKHALRLMEATNSFDYTKHYLLNLMEKAETEIHNLGGNKSLIAFLNKLKLNL